ncbi:rho gtpase-activating protein 68f [Anaeramoeba flamelloides]|uniref:Rho gtpase-activating protein 68f n=1 Tax=Anaeramoeba flamelloides TaxID=1746091 RepID=A0ABQ8X9F7_9EUKA|nr:rho gtpase-activating protein 68f [Anaeramoeba flamelloides]
MSQKFFKVILAYNKKRIDEMDLSVGDKIKFLRKVTNGMDYGQNLQNKQYGIYPTKNVVELADKDSENAPQKTGFEVFNPNQVLKEGFLTKKGENVKNWKKRYFKLTPISMSYYKKKKSNIPIKSISLSSAVVGKNEGEKKKMKNCWYIKTRTRTWEFKSENERSREEWVHLVTNICSRLTFLGSNQRKEKEKEKEKEQVNSGNEIQNQIKTNLPQVKSFPVFGVSLYELCKNESSDIPIFFTECIQHLSNNVYTLQNIFRIMGDDLILQKYANDLNSGKKIQFHNEKNQHNIASLFIHWLKRIPETLLTNHLYGKFMEILRKKDGSNSYDLKKLINQLPKVNKAILDKVTHLFIKLLNHNKINKINQTNLSDIFGPALFAKRNEKTDGPDKSLHRKLILLLIANKDYFFLMGSSSQMEELSKTNHEGEDQEISTGIVLFSYKPNNNTEDELTINRGDIISVIQKNNDNWWCGKIIYKENKEKIDNKFGYFPSNFVGEVMQNDIKQYIDKGGLASLKFN